MKALGFTTGMVVAITGLAFLYFLAGDKAALMGTLRDLSVVLSPFTALLLFGFFATKESK